MYANESIITILLTSAVMASLVTSLANIVIAVFNNRRLKSIEKEKQKNELTTYRYTHLFDMLLKWEEYDTPFETRDKSPSQIARDRILNSFFDSHRRFEIVSPFLDENYKKGIFQLYKKGEELLNKLFEIEFALEKKSCDKLREEHEKLFKEFIDISTKYTTEIKTAVRSQYEQLLKKINE